MIELHQLPKITKPSKKRLGRGSGSGRGKTAGRGTKGQKARGTIPLTLAQAGVSFIKRLPLYRGKYRNKPMSKGPVIVNVKYLNLLPKNSVVDLESLVSHHIVDEKLARKFGVKILGDGELTINLVVKLPVSNGAAKKIEAAGGKTEYKLADKHKSNKTHQVKNE